jgi:hypothetical protein
VPEGLGKDLKTLGQAFAECRTRQSLLCRVLFLGHSAKRFAECQTALGKEKLSLRRRVTETASLPSVWPTTLDNESIFAECPWWHSAKIPPGRVPMSGSLPSARCGTQQNVLLCRVLETLHSAKNLYRCPGLGSLPSAMVLTLDKAPLCRVSHSAKWPEGTFFICFPYSIQTNKRYHIYHIYTSQISSQT